MQHFSFCFAESRLLRFVSPEQPTNREEVPQISTSLRTLETSVFNQLKQSTEATGINFPYTASVECTDEKGNVTTNKYQPGFLVQKTQHGLLMLIGSTMRFVPDPTFAGSIAILDGGKKTVVRSPVKIETSSAASKGETETEQPAQSVPEPKKDAIQETAETVLQLSASQMGVVSASGKTLTFVGNESGTIRNALGSLSRENGQSMRATFKPAADLRETISFGGRIIFQPKTVDSVTTPNTQPQAVRPQAETPRRVNPSEPQRVAPSLQRETIVSPDASTAEHVQKGRALLESADGFRRLDANLRRFLRVYGDFWETHDRTGHIGKQVFGRPDYASFIQSIENNTYVPESQNLEIAAGFAVEQILDKMLGTENERQEEGSFIRAYNSVIRSRKVASMEEGVRAVYDSRYLNNPNGKYNEKVGRTPLYRNARTQKILDMQSKMKEAFVRLTSATLPESEVEAAAKDYRKFREAYFAMSGMQTQQYGKAWSSAERGLTMRSEEARQATPEQKIHAYWERHRYLDTLMMKEVTHTSMVPNENARKLAEQRIERYVPEYPR